MIGRLSCLAGFRGRPRFKAVPHHHTPLSHQVHFAPSGFFLPAWGTHDKLNGTPRRAESLAGLLRDAPESYGNVAKFAVLA